MGDLGAPVAEASGVASRQRRLKNKLWLEAPALLALNLKVPGGLETYFQFNWADDYWTVMHAEESEEGRRDKKAQSQYPGLLMDGW